VATAAVIGIDENRKSKRGRKRRGYRKRNEKQRRATKVSQAKKYA
jgi:hypothetical protein